MCCRARSTPAACCPADGRGPRHPDQAGRRALTDEEIRWFLSSYTADEIPEEQASALLMAIFFRGMDDDELATWTGR